MTISPDRLRWTVSLATLLLGTLSAASAHGQDQPIPPEYYTLDERNVDLVTGQFNLVTQEVVIGQPGAGGLVYGRVALPMGWRDLSAGGINCASTNCTVTLNGMSERFTRSGNTFAPVSQRGATLVLDAGGYLFTASDGSTARFIPIQQAGNNFSANVGLLREQTAPNGASKSYNYVLSCGVPPCVDTPSTPRRLQSIISNAGYQMHYSYASDVVNSSNFFTLIKVVGINLAVDYCAPTQGSCTDLTRNWPSVTYTRASDGAGGVNETGTDQSGRQTVYHTSSANEVDRIRLPGKTTDQISLLRNNGRVVLLTDDTGTWNYSYSDSGSTRTTVSTGPQSQRTTAVSNLAIGRATSVTEAVTSGTSRTTNFQYDAQQRLQRVTRPEGDATTLAYDARGNVLTTTWIAKPGSGLPNIVASAIYPASCDSVPIKVCNLPTSTTDPRDHVTNYFYDPQHGGLTGILEPAPAPGVDRPATEIAYNPLYAFYKNSSGAVVQGPTPMFLPTGVSVCAVGTECLGTPQEIRTSVSYGQNGVVNNRLPTSTTTSAGNGADAATTMLTYTPNGDVETVDGPLTTQPDVTRYVYDDARQIIGMIGPDPDGGGTLRNRATRNTYNPDGTVRLSQVGTTVGQGPTALASFTTLQQTELVHDQYLRPTQSAFTAGGTLYAVNQVFYDASGRPFCQVQRMNPATFLSPPSCAPTAGPFGPDRIAVATYDRASQPLTVTSGVGTPDALTETATWTLNGLPATLADGQGHISTMTYDGFDRLSRMTYPDPANGQPNPADYEEVTYDAASNVMTSRTRSDQTFTAAYDFLNRPTGITAPAPIAGQAATDSLAWTYDNIGRPLSATIPGGVSTAMTWDALGRQITETGPLGQMAMQYDPAGRRTRLTWPDAFFVDYGYDPTGAMTSITQGSAMSPIAAYAYDDLGRRTSVTRGNGVSTAYGYDPASRLTSLAHDLAGAANDNAYGYGHNPSGQIVGESRSNDAYAYSGLTAGTTQYGIDGLNRITAVNGTGLAYDANGNLTGDGVRTYAYDAANRLRTAGSVTLTYDALGRLNGQQAGSDQRYVYDGPAIVGFATGGTTLSQRFIPGAWPDEVVGNVAANGNVNLWLQDHLGSTVAITNSTGAASAINRYDDYGQPQSGNAGALQYTGQLWMPDAGLYHYKARAYHPGLGRFLQTDPIGYAAGMNLYGYVGGDPVNFTDPLGLCPADRPPGEACLPEIPVVAFRCGADFCITGADNIRRFLDSVADLGEIVVTGSRGGRAGHPGQGRTQSGRSGQDRVLDCVGARASQVFAPSALFVATAPLEPKAVVRTRESPNSSYASRLFRDTFGNRRLPFGIRLPAPTAATLANARLSLGNRLGMTGNVGRILGRGVPGVAQTGLAYEGANVSACAAFNP